MERQAVTARAGTNIALVKYWGKRDAALNLPAAGSLSLTLAELGTTTTVRFGADCAASDGGDTVILDGKVLAGKGRERVRRFLDLVRTRAVLALPAEVLSENTVPTAAGLASSASGFAALAVAASRAAGLELDETQLSELARRGSGSAARSIFGGFAEMSAGRDPDGGDAVARPLPRAEGWDVRLVVAVAAAGAKSIGSTEAMNRTAATSPYYGAWVESVERDLADARAAIEARDLGTLGPVVERSCMRMHASAMGADPFILYWNPTTLNAIQTVMTLRASGISVFFTIDAGPHVKALCRAVDAPAVEAALASTPGVLRTIVASPGPGARVVEEARP